MQRTGFPASASTSSSSAASPSLHPQVAYGRGRDRRVYDRDDFGFRARWPTTNDTNTTTTIMKQPRRPIPEPPRTPCSNPMEMPFPKLRGRSPRNPTMTVDEELLRALICQFTVKAAARLAFEDILEKLKTDNPHLSYLLYNDPDHLWAYIRLYTEHFAVDRDPRFPRHIWYLSKCKIVAKSDRRRYERELDAGNIIRPGGGGGETSGDRPAEDWDRIRYDPELERRSLIQVYAIFYQVDRKFKNNDPSYTPQIPTLFIRAIFESGDVPNDLKAYIGGSGGKEVDEFLHRRSHVFTVFGGRVCLRPHDYVDAIRDLTARLRGFPNGLCDIRNFFQYFCSSANRSPAETAARRKAMFSTGDSTTSLDQSSAAAYDDFLLGLHSHKFLFRLRTRDDLVQLRHGPVPVVSIRDIENVPAYSRVKQMRTFEELEQLTCAADDHESFMTEEDDDFEKRGGGGFNNNNRYPEFDGWRPKPSTYTMRWLNENFSSATSTNRAERGDRAAAGRSAPIDEQEYYVSDWGLPPHPVAQPPPPPISSNNKNKAPSGGSVIKQNSASVINKQRSDSGWPSLVTPQQQQDQSSSSASPYVSCVTSLASTTTRTTIGDDFDEWNGCN